MSTVELIMVSFRLEKTEAQQVNDAWEKYERENGNSVPYVEGVCEAIKRLADDGYVMAIVTNRERASLRVLLTLWDIGICFANITARENMVRPKPDPIAFKPALEAFRKFNISKDELVFVGDTIVDKEAGERAGIDTILVETGPYPHVHRETHPHPTHLIIPSAAHLPDWLEKVVAEVA